MIPPPIVVTMFLPEILRKGSDSGEAFFRNHALWTPCSTVPVGACLPCRSGAGFRAFLAQEPPTCVGILILSTLLCGYPRSEGVIPHQTDGANGMKMKVFWPEK